jgi:hypothetical protein
MQPNTPRDDTKAARRSRAAAQAILNGQIDVPLRCGDCRSVSIVPDEDRDAEPPAEREGIKCLQCGKRTGLKMAHKLRQQEIRMIIVAGTDPRPSPRRTL